MAEAVPAKSVQVRNFYRAECLIGDCAWTGREHGTYQGANAERINHLEEHRTGARHG